MWNLQVSLTNCRVEYHWSSLGYFPVSLIADVFQLESPLLGLVGEQSGWLHVPHFQSSAGRRGARDKVKLLGGSYGKIYSLGLTGVFCLSPLLPLGGNELESMSWCWCEHWNEISDWHIRIFRVYFFLFIILPFDFSFSQFLLLHQIWF